LVIAEVRIQVSAVVGLLLQSRVHLLLQTGQVDVVITDWLVLGSLELLAVPFVDLESQRHLVVHSVLVVSKGRGRHGLLSGVLLGLRLLLHVSVLNLPLVLISQRLDLAVVRGLTDQVRELGRGDANHWQIASTYLVVRLHLVEGRWVVLLLLLLQARVVRRRMLQSVLAVEPVVRRTHLFEVHVVRQIVILLLILKRLLGLALQERLCRLTIVKPISIILERILLL